MTRFAILGDTHLGCRNDMVVFHDHFDAFYDRLIADLQARGITTIFQLGDLFDRRKYINFNTLSRSKKYLFDKLHEAQIKMHVLIGNHDIFYRDSLSINSPTLVLQGYDNITIHDSPGTVSFEGTTIDMIPWVCADNEGQIKQFIASSKSDLCFGHFEIASFSMYRGMESHTGWAPSAFDRYELVCSGHFHTRSQKGNIVYVGTPYEMTWQDFDDPKGYHIFDTETRQLDFVPNPTTLFVKLEYNQDNLPDLSQLVLNNRFVKVIVTNKTDLYKFDQFMQALYNKQCHEVKVAEDITEFADGEIGEEIDLENTIDILTHYINSIETTADKSAITTFMKSLYIEAINSEVV